MCITYICTYTQRERERTMLNHFFAHSSQCGKYENEQTNTVSKEREQRQLCWMMTPLFACAQAFHFILTNFNIVPLGSFDERSTNLVPTLCATLFCHFAFTNRNAKPHGIQAFSCCLCCLSLFKVKWKFVLSFWINVLRMNFFLDGHTICILLVNAIDKSPLQMFFVYIVDFLLDILMASKQRKKYIARFFQS